MSKIFISTNPSKALGCFRESESNLREFIVNMFSVKTLSPIVKVDNEEIYLLKDSFSGEHNIAIAFDFEKDYILYHNESNNTFADKFTNKVDSIHNNGEDSLFRKVYLIITDANIINKYDPIKDILFPKDKFKINPYFSFLDDIQGNGGEELGKSLIELEKKYPDYTKLPVFIQMKSILFSTQGKNVYDINNKTHFNAIIRLRDANEKTSTN